MLRKPRVTTEQSAGNSSYFSLGFIITKAVSLQLAVKGSNQQIIGELLHKSYLTKSTRHSPGTGLYWQNYTCNKDKCAKVKYACV